MSDFTNVTNVEESLDAQTTTNNETLPNNASNEALQTHGESNDWKALDEIPKDKFIHAIIKKLKEGNFLWNNQIELQDDSIIFQYELEEWKLFVEFLDKKAKYFPIILPEITTNVVQKKGGNKKHNNNNKESAEDIIRKKTTKSRKSAIESISSYFMNDIVPSRTAPFDLPNCHIFYMIYWGIKVYREMRDNYDNRKDITILDCICSLCRMNEKIAHFPDNVISTINGLINEIINLYVEKNKKFKETDDKLARDRILDKLFSNEKFLVESFWEKTCPNSLGLRKEQISVVEKFKNAILHNAPLLLGYKVSPGSGKTFLAAVLAAILKEGHQMNHYDSSKGTQKILLYSCYNRRVRDMVSGLCRDADVPFWVVNSYSKREKMHTTLRPYKTLFDNFKASRREKDYFKTGTIDEQMLYYIEKTHTKPAIFISDPMSASILVDMYPERFIGYYDEITAGAESGLENDFIRHTCMTLKKPLRQMILVSATLPKFSELPSYRNHFISTHSAPLVPVVRTLRFKALAKNIREDPRSLESFLSNNYSQEVEFLQKIDTSNSRTTFTGTPIVEEVHSNALLVSCSVVGPDGYIYMPHFNIDSIEKLSEFVVTLQDDPSLMRMYEPHTVYCMMKTLKTHVPNDLLFENYFVQFGLIKHQSIRDYIVKLFNRIIQDNNIELFNSLKNYRRIVMNNVDQNLILTSNAHYYSNGKVIQVSSSNMMTQHISNISSDLLLNSPSLQENIQKYKNAEDELKTLIDNYKPTNSGKVKMSQNDIDKAKNDIMESRRPIFSYPWQYIVNSEKHAIRYGTQNSLVNPTCALFLNCKDADEGLKNHMSDDAIKLALSGIILNDTIQNSDFEKNFYNRMTNIANFFISDPNIVYGTNIKDVTNISITAEYGNASCSTKNSLYQLMGRAGRAGQSYSARIVFHSQEGLLKIFGDVNYEANVMETLFSIV